MKYLNNVLSVIHAHDLKFEWKGLIRKFKLPSFSLMYAMQGKLYYVIRNAFELNDDEDQMIIKLSPASLQGRSPNTQSVAVVVLCYKSFSCFHRQRRSSAAHLLLHLFSVP